MKHIPGQSNELADIVSREGVFSQRPENSELTQCFMIQMYQRGRGRSTQTSLDYAQYQQFIEFQTMNNLSISEGSEAESSDLNPPQKITKTEDDPENPWINMTGKLPAQLAQKRKFVHNIVDDIEQILYPPEFSKEEHSSKNIVGKVFLRNWHHKEQFQIGNLRKEFTKEELLIADNLWKAFSLNTRVELKQSIISALRQMRSKQTSKLGNMPKIWLTLLE